MNDNDNTRHTLLQKIQEPNNENSWEEFTEYYSGYIYVIIRNFRVDIEDSEDLLQDVLIKVWKGIRQYDYREKRSKFRTWLCSIVRNTVFNFLKSKSVKNAKQNVAYNEALQQMNLISDAEVDKIAEKEWQNYMANLAWDNIKNDLSKVNRLIFEDFLKGESNNLKLAEKHGVAETSVRVYKMRVKKALSKEIVRLNNELSWWIHPMRKEEHFFDDIDELFTQAFELEDNNLIGSLQFEGENFIDHERYNEGGSKEIFLHWNYKVDIKVLADNYSY
mgnify:CR=1 FL=1